MFRYAELKVVVGQLKFRNFPHESCGDYSEKYNAAYSFMKPVKVTKLFATPKVICDIYQCKRENRTTNYW